MGSLVSSVFGMDNGSKAGEAAVAAGNRYAKDVYFKPYTMTSGYGRTTYDPSSGTTASSLSAPYSTAEAAGLTTALQGYGGASNLLGQLGGFDVGQRASDIYGEQAALLQPSFQQQNADLQQQLAGSGRLGLRLSGGTVGAGGTGLVQPDAFGLGRAQQQTLAELASGARGQALSEMGQMADTATGLMSSGAQQAGVYAGLQDALTRLGIDSETARSAAAAAAGNVGTSGYAQATQAGMSQDRAMGDFWGGLFSSFSPSPKSGT